MTDLGYVIPEVGYVQTDKPKDTTPRIKDAGEYDTLPAGSKYLDPEGKQRYKPIKDDNDYDKIVEGQEYADPSGTIRKKPVFEPLNFSSQTLYDMSVTDSEKRKSLERSYPGKVKEDKKGLYIDDNGTLRRPLRLHSSGWSARNPPDHTSPTRGRILGPSRAAQAATLSGSAVR